MTMLISPSRLVLALQRAICRFVGSDLEGSRAVAAIEFAILAPLLILMLVSAVDLGFGIYRRMQVQNAAQAGASYAMLHGYLPNSISSAVTSATALSGITASPGPSEYCGCPSTSGITSAPCSSTCPDGAVAGTYVTVSAEATYNTILPYPIVPNSYTFNAQSTVRIQ
jgi:Flp pilus assembly protein TadG